MNQAKNHFHIQTYIRRVLLTFHSTSIQPGVICSHLYPTTSNDWLVYIMVGYTWSSCIHRRNLPRGRAASTVWI